MYDVFFIPFFSLFSFSLFFISLGCAVAGLYLYTLVVETFSGDNMKFRMYAFIGWGEFVILLFCSAFRLYGIYALPYPLPLGTLSLCFTPSIPYILLFRECVLSLPADMGSLFRSAHHMRSTPLILSRAQCWMGTHFHFLLARIYMYIYFVHNK